MKIAQLNVTCGVGSTGKICTGLSDLMDENGIGNVVLYTEAGNGHPNGRGYASLPEIKFQALQSRLTGTYGFCSKQITRRLVSRLDHFDPEIVHIHNIHGHNCDLEMLFAYLKERGQKIIWTFHDCWAFTGYCPHYDAIKCSRWKSGCRDCPQARRYSFFADRSAELYRRKIGAFSQLDMTIVTPSQWLAEQVKESFLKDYPVKVINNGIDLRVFQPETSDFRKRFHCEDKFILLGVAFAWGQKKGLDVFADLAKRLDERYQIVLVGTNEAIDKQLPERIISIHRTRNQQELAQIYSAADLFVNPTREDTYPTVNMEAIACGTPVLTFRTGGSPEILDETCGRVVECDDVDGLEREIRRICEEQPFTVESCLNRAKSFDARERFREYIQLYEAILMKDNLPEQGK